MICRWLGRWASLVRAWGDWRRAERRDRAQRLFSGRASRSCRRASCRPCRVKSLRSGVFTTLQRFPSTAKLGRPGVLVPADANLHAAAKRRMGGLPHLAIRGFASRSSPAFPCARTPLRMHSRSCRLASVPFSLVRLPRLHSSRSLSRSLLMRSQQRARRLLQQQFSQRPPFDKSVCRLLVRTAHRQVLLRCCRSTRGSVRYLRMYEETRPGRL